MSNSPFLQPFLAARKKIGSAPPVLFLSGILLFGCGEPQPSKKPDDVTLQLKWVHQAQFVGFYMAQEKGYYAGENLRVTFLQGGQGIDYAQRVLSGQADFGVMGPEDILFKRSQGEPLTAVAAIYRRSAVVFVAKADSGITRPADLQGKIVASGGGVNRDFELQFHAMMKKLGLGVSTVKVIPYDSTYAAFYKGEVDVTPCFSTGGLIKIRDKGMKLNLIWPSDYGIRFYSDTLATTDRMIREKPDIVTRFLRASLKGWQDAVGDQKEAVAVTLKYADVSVHELQGKMMEAQMPFVHTGEDKLGWMRPDQWNKMYQILLEQKTLANPFDVKQAYTMEFLKTVHGNEPE